MFLRLKMPQLEVPKLTVHMTQSSYYSKFLRLKVPNSYKVSTAQSSYISKPYNGAQFRQLQTFTAQCSCCQRFKCENFESVGILKL
jgi:hypothetical protein